MSYQDDFVAICAVRYALGRRSYAPGLVMEWVRESKISASARQSIAKEVLREITVDMAYAQEWKQFAEELLC